MVKFWKKSPFIQGKEAERTEKEIYCERCNKTNRKVSGKELCLRCQLVAEGEYGEIKDREQEFDLLTAPGAEFPDHMKIPPQKNPKRVYFMKYLSLAKAGRAFYSNPASLRAPRKR